MSFTKLNGDVRRGRVRIEYQVCALGDDLVVMLAGGTKEHIGTACLSQSRPSLTGQGVSSTSSALNVLGHKDEFAIRPLGEHLSSALGRTVLSCGGIHIDDASSGEIEDIQSLTRELAKELATKLST